jgi:hypothetical protein
MQCAGIDACCWETYPVELTHLYKVTHTYNHVQIKEYGENNVFATSSFNCPPTKH